MVRRFFLPEIFQTEKSKSVLSFSYTRHISRSNTAQRAGVKRLLFLTLYSILLRDARFNIRCSADASSRFTV